MILPKRTSISPAWALLLIAPVTAELLTSSMPPAEFLNPPLWVVVTVLYGSGAILARELRVRWHKGWPTLLVLGLVYGIFEEGLAMLSFFNPHHGDLGALAEYGRWAGVNWVWSVEIVIFHAVISIVITIMLTELWYPARRDESWVSSRTFKVLCVLFLLDVAFLSFVVVRYKPTLIPYLGTIALAVGLVILARFIPFPLIKRDDGEEVLRPVQARWFFCMVSWPHQSFILFRVL